MEDDRAPPYEATVATGVVGLAGFVDAVAFLMFRHDLVSVMSGNTVRGAVDLSASGLRVPRLAFVIGAFLGGVVTGSIVGDAARGRRRPVLLGMAATIFAGTAAAAATGVIELVSVTVAVAMLNTLSRGHGRPGTPVTYVTGTLVRFGENVANAATGGERYGWIIPGAFLLAFAGGAGGGALAERSAGTDALWVAAALSLGMAIATAVLDTRRS